MNKFSLILVGVVCLFLVPAHLVWGDNYTGTKNVFYLNSYHITYSWSDSVSRGIRRTLGEDPNIRLFIENLDAKRFGKTQFNLFYHFLKEKYRRTQMDVIILSDNDALDFFMQYNDSLFPSVPVVFCGVNNPQDYPLDHSRFFGIKEGVDQDSVNKLILQLMPGIKKLYFLFDSTTTSLVNIRYVKEIEPKYAGKVHFEYVANPGVDSLLQLVQTFSRGSAIALLDIFQDRDKSPVNSDYLVERLSEVSPVPIFMDSDPALGRGIAGGIINKGSLHGAAVARLALKILENPDWRPAMRVSQPVDHYYFDHQVLRRFQINSLLLPQGSILINQPEQSVQRYLRIFGLLSLVILILLGIISILTLNIRKRRQAEKLVLHQLAEIHEKNERIEEDHSSIVELLHEMEMKNEHLSELNNELEQARERAIESDNLKTSFLHNMSHEIRTPMNAILGFSTLLRDVDSPSKASHFIDIIEANCRTLLVLINDILDLSRLQSSKLVLKMEEKNLWEIATKIHDEFSMECEKKGLALQMNFSIVQAEQTMLTDEIRLMQVFSNLITNAIKFTEQGFIEFGISTLSDQITFYVQDTGIGIAPETGEKIFQRFFKLEDNQSRLYRGTGLGLSICKSLTDLWNGKIWYESTPGEGTIFYFTHPWSAARSSKSVISSTSDESNLHLQGKTILIAEDEASNYGLLSAYLEGSGALLLWARNGKEAVEKCSFGGIDLVLMDIKMPVMDGLEALKLIHEMNPTLPVIAQTAYAYKSEMEDFLKAGFDDYLTKPITYYDLAESICKFIPRKDT